MHGWDAWSRSGAAQAVRRPALARGLAWLLLGCLAAAPLVAVAAPAAAQPDAAIGDEVTISGTTWLVDAFPGDPMAPAPRRQAGVGVNFGLHGRIVGGLTSDEHGRWTTRWNLWDLGGPPVVAAFYHVPDPDAPSGERMYMGSSPPSWPTGVNPLTADVTLWRYEPLRPPGGGACVLDRPPAFDGGLLALSFALGDVMGRPLECEHVAPNGDVMQATSTGLAYQVAGTDEYVFTTGSERWRLGPNGEAEPAPMADAGSRQPIVGPVRDETPPEVANTQRPPETVTCGASTATIVGTVWAFDPATSSPPVPRAGVRVDWEHLGPVYGTMITGADGTYRADLQGASGTYNVFLEQTNIAGTAPFVQVVLAGAGGADTCRIDIVLTQPPPAELSTPLPDCGPETVTELMQPFAALVAALGEPLTRAIDCATLDPASGETVQRTRGGMAFYQPWDHVLVFTDGWRRWRVEQGTVTEEVPDPETPAP